ncbi:MAG: hypothetical protein ABIT71_12360 [Vicinamibacteraceae bacterium]
MSKLCRLPTPPPLATHLGARLCRASSGLALVCFALLCAASPARGQTATYAGHESEAVTAATALEALIQRVDQLEAEVRTLRAQLATRTPDAEPMAVAAAPSPVSAPAMAATATPLLPAADAHDHAAADAAAAAEGAWQTPRTQFHWFSDVGFTVSDRDTATSSFGLGQLDLFLTSALNERWSVLSEIVFRANADNRFVVNPERLLLQYQPSDAVQIAMGRFHSAVGYYNTVYHHGSWFETAAARPSLFAAGLVPYHNVGVSTHLKVPSGSARLELIGELGNGLTSGSRALEPTQNVVDENNHKAFNVAATVRPEGLEGFQTGASWYRDRLTPIGRSPIAAHTMAAHAVYTGHGWEILNELVAARHADEDGSPARVAYGWYSQSSYRIRNIRPYLRYQAVQGNAADPIFGSLGHRYGPVAGVRVDLGRFAALKVHLDHSRQSATGTTSNDGVVKLAFTF